MLLRDTGKEQVGYHSWIQEGKSPLMMGRRNCGCMVCSMVLGLIVILLSVSVLEDVWYEEFQDGVVLVQCESWSPGCSGEPWLVEQVVGVDDIAASEDILWSLSCVNH